MPVEIAVESLVLRMYEDLRRALKKPLHERRWGMVIDIRKCVGCHACTVACKVENKLPPGILYNVVMDEESGIYPNVVRRFIPRPCLHCRRPPCVQICPVGATYKRDDGIVAIDYDKCIGCRRCIPACPYGARSFDLGNFYTAGQAPEVAPWDVMPSFEYGEEVRREPGNFQRPPVGKARKCHFCIHRLEKGMLPACVTTCIGQARIFGDLNDPESLVAQMAASPRATRLKEELGTEPSVYHLL